MEALIADLAASFVDLPVDSSDVRIHQAFDRLLDFFHLDRVAMWEFSHDRSSLILLHHRKTTGTPAPPPIADAARIEWMMSKLQLGQPIFIHDPDELPAEAEVTRASMREKGIRSWLALPLRSNGRVFGALVFVSMQRAVQWTEKLAVRLQIVADMFGSALARERAQQALRRSELLKSAILGSLSSHVAVIDRSGQIIAVNTRWMQFAADNGAPPASRVGVGANYLDICRSCGTDSAVCETVAGIESVLNGSRDLFELEYPCHAPGAKRWFHMDVTPLTTPEGGAVISHVDITARKLAEFKLRESEERFRKLIDECPVPIWMHSPDKELVYVNRAALDFAGLPLDAFLGHRWVNHVSAEDLEKDWALYSEAFAARQPFTIEYRHWHSSGHYRWLLAHGGPRYLPDGSFAGYIGVSIDIHDRKEAEAARHAMAGRLLRAQEEERSRIARELHDDIAQRLTLLTIKLQQLEQTAEEPAAAKQVADARKIAKQLSLDVAHLSHNLHSSYLENLGLGEATRSQCTECASLHHLAIDCRVEGLPDSINKDVSLALFRVVQEALRNIVKHSHSTEVEVRLSADKKDLRLVIIDNGIGFETSVAHNTQGLGLMSMSERLRLLGGDLQVTSKPSQGTRLEARVPLQRPERRAHPRGLELEATRLAG